MGLQAHAIDLDPPCLELGDERGCGSGLGAWVLDAVVVIVELDVVTCGSDGLGGELVGEEEVLRSNGVVPDAGGEGAVGIQGLVNDVPAVAAAAPVGDEVRDVGFHYRGEGGVCPVAIGNPIGQLICPDEIVAADVLAMRLGDVEEYVTAGVVENTGFRLAIRELWLELT